MSIMSPRSRVSRYMLRLIAWSIHFCARAATSRNAYGESWKLVLYVALTSSGICGDALDVALRCAGSTRAPWLPQARAPAGRAPGCG